MDLLRLARGRTGRIAFSLRLATLGWVAVAGGSGCDGDGGTGASHEDGGARDAASSPMDDSGADASAGDAGAGSLDSGAADASDAGADAAAVESTPLPTYCSRGAARYYAWLQQCYGEDHYTESMRADFVGRIEGRCMHAGLAVEEARLRYDGQQATRCLAVIEAVDCVGQFFEDEACQGIFEGLVAEGDDCYDEESRVFLVGISACADGYCDDDNACPGSCIALPDRGDSCDGIPCRPEDYCDGTDLRCRARSSSGEACVSEGCEQGLTCFGEEEPICVAPATGVDAACGASTPCAGAAICVEGRCRWHVEAGDPCVVQVQCPDGLLCAPNPNGEGRICLAPGDEDAVCTEDVHCNPPLICITEADETAGACGPDPFVAGEPCDEGRCAEGLWCAYEGEPEGGVCREKVGEGEDCTSFNLPESGACLDGLYCTEAGTCAPPGDEGDPCNVFGPETCTGDLWCSRATGLCTAPASEDSPCNPFWPNSCADGLGCACGLEDRDLCGGFNREPSATDTCKPQVADGEACFRTGECQSLECQFDFDAPSTMAGQCVSPPMLCLP